MADQQPRQPSFRPFFRMASIARIEPPPPPQQPPPPVTRPLRLPSLLGQPAAAALPQAQPQPTPPPPPARPQIQAPAPALPQPPTPPPPPARPQIQAPSPAQPQQPTPPPPPARPQIQAPAQAQPQPPPPVRPQSQAPAPAQPPTPPARPQIQAPTQTQQPTPPSQPQPLREPTPPPPSPRPAAAASRNLTPPQSPRVIKTASSTPTPPASPRTRLQARLAPNPEPEPDAQAASQQKSVVMNQSVANSSVKAVAKGYDDGHSSSSNGSSPPLKKEQRSSPTAAWDGNASTAPSTAWKKKAPRSGDEGEAEAGIRSITIAGENLGAYMELVGSQAHRRHGQKLKEVHQQEHALKTNPVWKQVEESGGSGTEKRSNEAEEKAVRGAGWMRPMAAAVNSNVQGINNSLMMNSSCKHGSPGVHITLRSHRGKHKNSGGTTDHHPQ